MLKKFVLIGLCACLCSLEFPTTVSGQTIQATPISLPGIATNQLSTPLVLSGFSVTNCSGGGSTTYYYSVAAVDFTGATTTAVTNTGGYTNTCASPSSTGYISFTVQPVLGAKSCNIYRQIGTGMIYLIDNIQCGAVSTYHDFTPAGMGSVVTLPTGNTTGGVAAAGIVTAQAFNAGGSGAGTEIMTSGSPLSACPTTAIAPYGSCIPATATFFQQAPPGFSGNSVGITWPSALSSTGSANTPFVGPFLFGNPTGTPSASPVSIGTLMNPLNWELATASGTFLNNDLLVVGSSTTDVVDSGIMLSSGKIPNSGLANSAVTVNTAAPLSGGGAVNLGASISIACASCNTSNATVSTFSAGNLSPLFTTTVANATTTPALSFSLSSVSGGTVFGNNTTGSAAPSFTAVPVIGNQGLTAGSLTIASTTGTSGSLTLNGNSSGSAKIIPQTVAGTGTTLTLPNTSGTLADGATGPLSLSTTTGQLSCPTCATTTSGGALTATAPISISSGGVIAATLSGNGTNIQSTNMTSSTTGDIVTLDGHANTVDSAILLSSLAPLASPTFTGVVTIPTVNVTSAYQLNGTTIQASAILTAFCLGTIGTTAGTFILVPAVPATTANCNASSSAMTGEMPMPYACVASHLYAVAGGAGNNATGSGVTTLYRNNTATGLGGASKCVIGTGTTCHDTSDTVSFSAGDTWSVRTTSNGAGETLQNVRVAFQCQ